MLAGIAHDLRAPITRLRFRLSLQHLKASEQELFDADLQALERITDQFLVFAGAGDREQPLGCPLDQWLSETIAGHPKDQLQLELTPVQATIRPVALSRAVSNVIDNALCHGDPPVVVRLSQDDTHVLIEVWDQGQGIPDEQWQRALQPFQRIDAARGRQGHCGLGLAIVNHVIQQHNGMISGGELQRVALLRALLLKPAFLVADEPASRLDPITSEVVSRLLVSSCRERQCTLLFISHDRQQLEKLCDRVIDTNSLRQQ